MKNMKLVRLLIIILLCVSGISAKDIYSLIRNGEIDEARDSLSRLSTARQRDGNHLYFLSLLEKSGGKSAELIEASLNAGVSGIYREDMSLRLAQYYLLKNDFGRAAGILGEYPANFEKGKNTPDIFRYSVYLDEKNKRYEGAIRQTDKFLLEYPSEEFSQWGLVDKARVMMNFDKKIAARDLLTKLSREKSGPGVPAALYVLALDAAERNRADDAVFYYNLLREAYPSAIGLDALLDKMSGLGRQTQREKSADIRTGTFYSVQVGVFAAPENARRLAKEFEQYGQKIEITTKKISDRTYHVVLVGRFDSYETAVQFEKTIEAEHDDVYQVVAR